MKKILLFLVLSCMLFNFEAFAQIESVKSSYSDCPVGIFINGKIIDPIKYSKIKSGKGAFLSGLTYGLAKASNVNEFEGASSPNILKKGDYVVFIFDHVPPEYVATMWQFSPNYSPNNFGIGKFKVKKQTRELQTSSVSLWKGAEIGSKETTDVTLSAVDEDNGFYSFQVTKALPGEYCFMFTDSAAGGFHYVFDFSVR